jgi:hypothetical protein
MGALEVYQTEWEGLRLVVERQSDHWQYFVYDVANCEVLHTAARLTDETAKIGAMEFAMSHLYGPEYDLKPEVMIRMLLWEPGQKGISGAAG